MIKKDTCTREEVIEILQEMQMETFKCVGFIAGMVTQGWVIKDMLGKRIEKLGGETFKPEFCGISERMDTVEGRKQSF